MESKLSDIMAQFSREMEATSTLFRTLKVGATDAVL
jgi:hypothetical protein